ncbi:MAG: hypothetical protein LRY39_00280 [Alphaproteobacteria bacterium]|nr:hypothetical protein [Alphaproteobacteria bacterium]
MAAEQNSPAIIHPLNAPQAEPQGQKVLGHEVEAQGALQGTSQTLERPGDNIAQAITVEKR